MKTIAILFCLAVIHPVSAALFAQSGNERGASGSNQDASPLKYKMKTLGGEEVLLAEKYAGKVVLIVNTASKCGLTPQYKQLQALHEKYADQGLAILGFPCNQFAKQEPGTASEIGEFCQQNYGVEFDMFAKIDVNGKQQCELYRQLTSTDLKPVGKGKISWNFEKFLIDSSGKPAARFGPRTEPDDRQIIEAIEELLKQDRR